MDGAGAGVVGKMLFGIALLEGARGRLPRHGSEHAACSPWAHTAVAAVGKAGVGTPHCLLHRGSEDAAALPSLRTFVAPAAAMQETVTGEALVAHPRQQKS